MPNMLLVEEVAKALRVTPQTVRNWVRLGKIQGTQLERTIRIPASELQRLQRPRPTVSPDLLRPRSWQDVLGEFETHFQMGTVEMLQRRAAGSVPDLGSSDDERLFEAWCAAADVAVDAGLPIVTPDRAAA